jgi:hypothetical protein
MIMSIRKCKHCDFRSQRNNQLTRHIEICSIRLERKRRVKFRLNRLIVHDHRRKARKKRRNNNFDVDEKKTFISINENLDDFKNEITNEMIVNDNTSKFNDDFLLNISRAFYQFLSLFVLRIMKRQLIERLNRLLTLISMMTILNSCSKQKRITDTNRFKTKRIMRLRIDFIRTKITKETLIDFVKIHDWVNFMKNEFQKWRLMIE